MKENRDMEEILKAYHQDQTMEQVAKMLYGEGAYEVVKSMTAAEKKAKKDRALQNVAIGTNAVGSVAGPAAIGLAYRARKTGGMPREGVKTVAPKMAQSKNRRFAATGKKLGAIADKLDNPKGRGAKIAAGAAGVGLIGMQGINWGGDMLSAKIINEQKKKDKLVAKSKEGAEPPKLKLVKTGAKVGFKALQDAPAKT